MKSPIQTKFSSEDLARIRSINNPTALPSMPIRIRDLVQVTRDTMAQAGLSANDLELVKILIGHFLDVARDIENTLNAEGKI